MKHVLLLIPLLLIIPAQADAWVGTLYAYERDGLISLDELQAALAYLHEIGFIMNDTVLFYSVDTLPEVTDKSIPATALAEAIESWENSNPGLVFVESDDADIMITWAFSSNGDVGADCWHDGQCTVSLGGLDCDGNYVQADVGRVQHSLMHGIGHAMGLEHVFDESSLMHGDGGKTSIELDGYSIPAASERWFVGESDLVDRIAFTDRNLALFETQFIDIEGEFKAVESKLVTYDGKIGSMKANLVKLDRLMAEVTSAEYVVLRAEYDMIRENLGTVSVEYATALAKHKALVELYGEKKELFSTLQDSRDRLAAEYACYPGVD